MNEWSTALEQMIQVLAATLTSLEGSCAELEASERDPRPQLAVQEKLESRLSQWDDRLTAAEVLAAQADETLREREATVAHWGDLLAKWRNLIDTRLQPTMSQHERG
jgi:hypothetical protein